MLITSNDEMNNIIKIVKSLEDSSLLPKEVSETIHHEGKEQRGGFFNMFLNKLGTNLLGKILAGINIAGISWNKGINRVGEGNLRAAYGRRLLNSSISYKNKKRPKNKTKETRLCKQN